MKDISKMDISEIKGNAGAQTYVRLTAGTSLVRIKPCFSKNSSYIFVVADNAVKVYSTKTSECIHILNTKCPVEALFVNPSNECQLVTVSSDGTVYFWDYEDALLIREISLNTSVICAYPGQSGNSLFAIIPEEEKNYLKEFLMDFTPKRFKFTSKILFEVASSKKLVAINKSATLAAAVMGNALYVNDTKGKKLGRHLIPDNLAFTCVAWHPEDECLATGDSEGRILLWYNCLTRYVQPTRMKLHWHTLPVADISFTNAGSFLFSGGNECVLVKWKPGSNNKLFLPRMGMPICHITCSPDNSLVASSHVDNSILLTSPTLKVQNCIQGLACNHRWEETSENPVPTGLLYAPHLEALVLNGRMGHLQFYSLVDEKQLYNLDITQQNYITRERNRTIYQLEVTKAAFDPTGRWLATVEHRDDKETSQEIRLKFWEYKDVDQKFSLCTTIEMPHWDVVNSLLFRPINSQLSETDYAPMAFTTSEDKRLRIWSLVEDRDSQGKEKFWTCQSVGFYRDFPSRSASISEDGSILAVAFGHAVTLWMPECNVLRASLCHPRHSEDIRQVVFGRHDCSHLVTSTTESSVTVWDILSLSALWTVQVGVMYLVGDPFSSSMAAFSNDGDLFIFRPSNPEPLHVHTKACTGKVIAAAYIPRTSPNSDGTGLENSQLYFMNSEQQLFIICSEEELREEDSKIRKVVFQKIPMTPFGMMMAESRKSGVEKVEQQFHEIQGSTSRNIIKMMINSPCHVLPSPMELCSAYLSSLLKPLSSRVDGEQINKDKDEAVHQNSSSESDGDDDDDSGDSDSKLTTSLKQTMTDVKDDSDKTGFANPVADENCLRAVANEDYSWLFTPQLFASEV